MVRIRAGTVTVLVDQAPLLDQCDRLTTVLDIDPKRIGQIGGGKTTPAPHSGEALWRILARRWVGLTAAAYGRDASDR